ncbi:MAG: hypothetical protein Q7T10_13935 [Rhodoferax sp.]|uniref:hypothetical protein n=1 Tax=Rhodoferax sp. TaxID=50421 RepID=UPI00271C2E86|nr:hypothetical protein [Rhodoferax sp.]MDO8449893.1 hypothetical protein [Rhodoferax sp.]
MSLPTSHPVVDHLAMADFPASAQAKLDPYLLAAISTGFADYSLGLGDTSTVAIGFKVVATPTQGAEDVEHELGRLFASTGHERLTTAHLGSLVQTGCAYLTANVSFDLLRQLAAAAVVTEIQLCANLAPNRPVPRLVADQTGKSASRSPLRAAKDKILGLIDHGCPFAHRAFLAAGKTRVFAIWDQDELPDFPVKMGSIPSGYGYGRQVGADSLNQFIRDATTTGRIDEDLCYRLAEYGAVRSRSTHGSLTMGLLASRWLSPSLSATGRSQPVAEAADADIIFVQLPRDVLLAPARGSIDRCTLDGIRYILDCAPDNAHVAVVVDYGTEMGPHDGSSWFERALDAMVDEALRQRNIKLDVVFPSGNSHDKYRHAVVWPGACVADSQAELGWWIPKGNDAPVTVEIWMEHVHSDFEFSLIPPGAASTPITFNANTDIIRAWPAAGAPLCVIVDRQFGEQRQIVLQVSPTNLSRKHPAAAPSGIWTLTFKASAGALAGPLFAYACWGGQNPGIPKRLDAGRFIVRPNQMGLVSVQGDGSILGSACGEKTLMIGGHEMWGHLDRANYSSGGACRGGPLKNKANGANWLAATEESPVLGGLLCLGTRSGSLVRARGTSFAAPQVAGKITAKASRSVPHVPYPGPLKAGYVKNCKARKEYGERRLQN